MSSDSLSLAEPPKFATRDLGEARDYIHGFTGTHTFRTPVVANEMYFAHHERQIGHISLNYTNLHCARGFEIGKSAGADCYAFQFVLEGCCDLDTTVGRRQRVLPGEVFILGPDEISHEHWPSVCRQFVVRVEQEFVDRLVRNEIRASLKQPLAFKLVARDPGIASWFQHIISVPEDTDSPQTRSVLTCRRVVRSMEYTLTMMLLAGFEHSESEEFHRPSPTIAPYYVKRAEEFIRSHAREDLTVDRIAAAAGVSVRSIFYGFEQWRKTSPMAHVRELRLGLARRQLQAARDSGTTVSQAAVNAGFTNFSQFSKIYKARFGETPSTTLRQAIGADP